MYYKYSIIKNASLNDRSGYEYTTILFDVTVHTNVKVKLCVCVC